MPTLDLTIQTCGVCGALIGIGQDGKLRAGNSVLHMQWHRDRGDVND